MTALLEDYPDIVEELGEHAIERLRSAWEDAARSFSTRGIEEFYLKGARALASTGRGTELVASFIDSSPLLARELGEEAVRETLAALMKMYSKTSGAVLALLLDTSPAVASRLGDLDLYRSYLGLIEHLLALAPRGVRPMLERMNELLEHLTLGGLRRWAVWGAQAHKTDIDAQLAYFSLSSPESLKILQNERRGTLFVDVQRRINMYLRALWGRDFLMRPTSGDFESRTGYRPYIEGFFMHLPDAFDDVSAENSVDHETIQGLAVYRAAAAHAAAHIMHTTVQFQDRQYGILQRVLIGMVEDARVESLAIGKFPGLGALWWRFHTTSAADGDEAQPLFSRLSRALLDPDYQDPNSWIAQAQTDFFEMAPRWGEEVMARELGLRLSAEHARLNLPFSPSQDLLGPVYRDDNRYIWEFEDFLEAHEEESLFSSHHQVRKRVNLMEMINEVDNEFADDSAEEIWILPTEFYRDGDDKSMNQLEGKEPISPPVHYPEWDYQMQLDRPYWVTLHEKRPSLGNLETIEDIITHNRPLVSRLRYLIDALQPQGVKRVRKQEDGDELDINAAVDAMIETRMGRMPDPRIMIRNVLKVRDISILLLIDLSESTNDKVRGKDYSVLDLAREAAAMLAYAMDKVGDRFAIHGFDSNGRHDVEYFRYKDFDMPYNDLVKARLAGMTGQLSTRMGAAIRHASHLLNASASGKKLMLIITDGEPADNDVRDPQYLRLDAKKAVEEAGRQGIQTFCMTLDPYADEYVSRIFGPRNYMIVDHVERLPEKLPLIYAGLTR